MSQENVSPARASRVQEKEELAHLNDRFVQYIDQVKSMKELNRRLEMELCSTKEQLGTETAAVKELYEGELADARNLIDETAKEKARQQIKVSKHETRIEELEAELKTCKEERDRFETQLTASERSNTSLDAQRKSALADKNRLQKEVKNLQAELAEMREGYESLQGTLEVETLSKVDLQNKCQSLREELLFNKKLYEEELSGLRNKLSWSVSTPDTDFQAQLDHRLEIAIDELRDKSEADIADYKIQIDSAYKDKITALENQCARDSATISKLSMEINRLTSGRSDQGSEIGKLQRAIEKLECALRDKDDELGRVCRQHTDDMSQTMDELRTTRESYEVKIREYEQLMDLKVQLDQEIATYRALLQEEETRLNLTPTPREKRTRTRTQTGGEPVPIPKKMRLETPHTQAKKSSVSSSAVGRIHITDVDPEGRYVEIKNMSDEVEPIKGIKIQHEVEGRSEMIFRFSAKSKLQGGATVTVWSGDADGAVHNPPSNLIWKNQSWGSGQKTVTKLIKGSDTIAQFNQSIEISPCKPQQEHDSGTGFLDSSTRSFPSLPDDATERDASGSGSGSGRVTMTTRYSSSTSSSSRGARDQRGGGEHMFHQQGDPAAEEKTCVIS
ncbi:lamin-B2-like [Halichondria panicea]|uniref:lamin-B2-like n=1 Tax=Halichondria panicea TaxID=6063 RepID=UPI00312B9F03